MDTRLLVQLEMVGGILSSNLEAEAYDSSAVKELM